MAIYKSKNRRIRLFEVSGPQCTASPDEVANPTKEMYELDGILDGKGATLQVNYKQWFQFDKESKGSHRSVYVCEYRGHRGWVINYFLPSSFNISSLIKRLIKIEAEKR